MKRLECGAFSGACGSGQNGMFHVKQSFDAVFHVKQRNESIYFPMQKSRKITSRMSSTSTRPVSRPSA